jgi:hypothetical protein
MFSTGKLYLMASIAVTVIIGFVALAGQSATTTHAQLSCDNPPSVTLSISSVWNLTDFCTYEEGVFDEILSGGVGRDGIPPIDNPQFESIEDASEWLSDQSPVIAVEIEGLARAYPLAILTRHEIVNDVIGEIPVAVTFCPLCNAAIVFDRRVDDETYRFGVSGFLRNSDLIMWDDQTQSWWQQFTGTGIVGQHTGHQLDHLPSQVVGFSAFVDQYPDGEVLSGSGRSYGSNPYVGYDSSSDPFLFRGDMDDRLFPTSRVLAGVISGVPVAYPFETLANEVIVNDTVGERDVVAFWQPGSRSALDQRDIDSSRDVGMAALFRRTLDDQILTFFVDNDGTIRDEETNSAWNVFGTAVEGELEGKQLRQEIAGSHFWFAWAAFQPDTLLYDQ